MGATLCGANSGPRPWSPSYLPQRPLLLVGATLCGANSGPRPWSLSCYPPRPLLLMGATLCGANSGPRPWSPSYLPQRPLLLVGATLCGANSGPKPWSLSCYHRGHCYWWEPRYAGRIAGGSAQVDGLQWEPRYAGGPALRRFGASALRRFGASANVAATTPVGNTAGRLRRHSPGRADLPPGFHSPGRT